MSAFQLLLFEDRQATRFLPLAWTRPLFELRCGIETLREALERAVGQPASALFVRPFLAPAVRERSGLPVNELPPTGPYLFLNGRLLAGTGELADLTQSQRPRRVVNEAGTLLAAWVERLPQVGRWEETVAALPTERLNLPLLDWPWELFQRNGERIIQQAAHWPLGEHPAFQGVHYLEAAQIYVAPSARIQPGVVLDASAGPIVIDEGAQILANAVLQGPCYIGPGSMVKIAAKLYHGTSVGPRCKVGGEVEETIFQGYSNKQHDGFLGHAFVGEWCNFGADTNNSDLKNNYGTVSIWCEGKMHDTDSLFVGLLMGDHSKTGINSMLNTGTVVGVSCNLFGAALPPRFVPSFSWGGAGGLSEYRLEKALETAQRVMERRDRALTQAEAGLLRHIFAATRGEQAVG